MVRKPSRWNIVILIGAVVALFGAFWPLRFLYFVLLTSRGGQHLASLLFGGVIVVAGLLIILIGQCANLRRAVERTI
jgi:hypothetical protein